VPDLAAVKKQILGLSNQFRSQNKRAELKLDTQLSQAAQSFAEYMARTDKFSHTADGKEPWQRVVDQGYAYCIVLENIAYEFSAAGFTTAKLAEDLIQGWEKSPPHRKNLLDPDVLEIGLGIAQSSKSGRHYAVQVFGRPKSKQIVFKIANPTDATVKYTIDGKSFSISPGHTVAHERCRPPELRIEAGAGKTDAQARPLESFHPKDGERYAIHRDDAGNFTLRKEIER
jgi:hypothetical protein